MSGTRSSLRLDDQPKRLAPSGAEGISLVLLDRFEVAVGGRAVRLPAGAQRVVAFVALHERPLLRSYVAGSLWLDSSDERAAANLRTVLWRIQRLSPRLIDADSRSLRLGSAVRLDLRDVERLARAELRGGDAGAPTPALASDLLPGWYEDWVLIERERFRQLRLRALEALCERLTRERRLAEALDVGRLAVAAEPLRESAHRALIRAQLADGHRAEALRQYRLCRRLLREELGVEPSERMRELVRGLDGVETMW